MNPFITGRDGDASEKVNVVSALRTEEKQGSALYPVVLGDNKGAQNT